MDEKENELQSKVTDSIFNFNKRIQEIEKKIEDISKDNPLSPKPGGEPNFRFLGRNAKHTFYYQQDAAKETQKHHAELNDLLKDQEPEMKQQILENGKKQASERAEDYKSWDQRQERMDSKIEDYKSTKTFDPATYSPSQDLKFESRQELLEGYTNNAIDIEFDRD
jgi:hypothetical protein